MTKRWKGYTAAVITAGMVLGGMGTVYGAPKTDEAPAEEKAEAGIDRSMVDTTGFAKSEESVNVRASGDTEGEIVGTLNLNDSVYIEDVDENGWYKIRSGNVEGYVAGYLIATGEEAESIAREAAYTYATVGAETLNIRSDASGDSEVVDMVGQNANLEVVEDLGDWVKVVTDSGVYGYVSTNYVYTETVYPTGETVQEQAEREEKEYQEAAAQQEAEYASYVAQQEAAAGDTSYTDAGASYADTSYTEEAAYTDTAYTDTAAETAYTDTTYTDTGAQTASYSDVDALYQAYLTAQDAAMTATSEEDATAKANAAIEAYNAYLAACGSTQTVAPVETSAGTTYTDTSSADTTYTDTTYTDSTYTDTTYTDTTSADTTYTDTTSADTTYTDTASADTTYTDTTSTDTTYTDTASADTTYTDTSSAETTSSSSGSGVGADIAAYASQFVGNPYVYGGSSLTSGADCSGFTMSVMANYGVSLPHNAAAQSGCGTPVSLSDLQAGDLLFYGDGSGIGHVAIYRGDGTVVHASNPESGIKVSSYDYRSPVAAVRVT